MQTLAISGHMRLPFVWRKVSVVFGGFGFVALAAANIIGPDDWYMLGLLCVSVLAYAIIIIVLGFRDGMRRILTDPFLILIISFSLYYLVGPLLLIFGSEDEISYVVSWYPVTAINAVLVTSINLIGLAIMLYISSYFNGLGIVRTVQPVISFFSKYSVERVFWLFAMIGFIAFAIVQTSDELVSGTIRILAQLLLMAILLGTICQGRGSSRLHSLAIMITIFTSVMGLLSFSKSEAMLPIVVLVLGLYLRSVSIKLIVIILVIVFLGLGLIVKPITEARIMLLLSADNSLSNRYYILQEAFQKAYDSTSTNKTKAGLWTRLCYVPPQVASVDLFDKGQGGHDMELMFWVFIPRAIYPDKPIITRTGNELNAQVTGSESSSTGVGLFVGGYYSLGWVGIILVSVISGLILSIFATVSRLIISSGLMIGLPVGLFGNFMAFRIDGYFVGDYLGPFAMIMMTFLTVLFILHTGIPKTSTK